MPAAATTTIPRVFISFSHDSDEHDSQVGALANRLRKDGVNAQLDQYVNGAPEMGWPSWMVDRFDWANFVFVICTETYYRRFRGHEVPGSGKGVAFESILINNEIYDRRGRTSKFVPVLFNSADRRFIPETLRGYTPYDVSSERDYAALRAFLFGTTAMVEPELGSARPLSSPAYAADFAAYPPLATPPRFHGEFVGRAADLEKLERELVGRDGPTRATIVGLGGVGKTTLAKRFAEAQQSAFRGGVLWGDLGTSRDEGERDAKVTPEEALRGVLQKWCAELGRPSDGCALETLMGVVKQLIAERVQGARRLLVILDNADTLATVNRLCAELADASILVTTRQRDVVGPDDGTVVELSGFDGSERLEYLRRILPGDPRAGSLGNVLDYVQGHPLATHLIAQMLRAEPSLTAESILERFRETGRTAIARPDVATPFLDTGPLDDCFRVSIRALPRPELRTFLIAAASQAPTSWSLQAADHTSGVCALRRSWRLAGELTERGLIERLEGDRFGIHRLLRDHLRRAHGGDGFGWIPQTWEPRTLAPLLMRMAPGVSAGLAVYDGRQEQWHLRFAREHRDDPPALRREWDGILAGVARRAEANRPESVGKRLEAFKEHLRGADLTGLTIRKAILEGLSLHDAKLDDSDLQGEKLRWFSLRIHRMAIPVGLCLAFSLVWWWQLGRWDAAAWWLATFLLPCAACSFVEGGRWLDGRGRLPRFVAEFLVLSGAFLVASVPSITLWLEDVPRVAHRWFVALAIVGASIPTLLLMYGLATLAFVGLRRVRAVEVLGGLELRCLRGLLFFAVTIVCVPLYIFVIQRLGAYESKTFSFAHYFTELWRSLALLALGLAACMNPETDFRLWSVQATYLRRVDLARASFKNARLASARFEDVDIRDADFSGADLRGAAFTGCRHDGARFDRVRTDQGTRLPSGVELISETKRKS